MPNTTEQPKSREPRVLLYSILFIGSYFAARVALRIEALDQGARIVAALLPVPLFAAWLWSMIRSVRLMDELEQRIHLEALVIAFPLGLILLMTLGLLELATELPPEDLSYRHVWALMPTFYFIGLALAKSRYR